MYGPEAAPSIRPEPVVGPVLVVVREVLDRLHAADLPYCHWKSNEHLGAALAGSTDLDILVDRRRGESLQCILAEAGFKHFVAPPLRAYPGIEDHLALDPVTGRLVHLHLHYQLTLGERHLKGYHLPWESIILSTRRLDPAHGIYVADPGLEFLLLLTRAALKRRTRDRLRPTRRLDGLAATDFGREFEWLRRRIDPASVRELGRGLLGPAIVEPLERLLGEPPAPASLDAFAARARPALSHYRTYGPLEARLRAWLRELQWAADAINRRYLHQATPLRRVSPRGGVVVALLGSDGAGKSTMVRALTTWLGAKLDVVPIYFGSGDGPSAIYRRPMKLAYRPLRPLFSGGNPARSAAERADASSVGGRLREILRAAWALALSCEKRGKSRRAVKARNRAMIVVCDRFPQAQVKGFNDGPLLAHWRERGAWLRRALARWEAQPYEQAVLNPPDLVIKLIASPEVALGRKPDMTAEEIRRRVQAVRGLSFPPTTRVVELDADAPLEEVVRAAKRLLWQEV